MQRSQGRREVPPRALGPGSRDETLALPCSAPALSLSAVGGRDGQRLAWSLDMRSYMVSLEDVASHAQQVTLAPGPDYPEGSLQRNKHAFLRFLSDKYVPFVSWLSRGQREVCAEE